jgi:hypothetical protein
MTPADQTLRAAIAARVAELVAAAPPITDEQRAVAVRVFASANRTVQVTRKGRAA